MGTTALLSTGRIESRKVVGSMSAAEFVVAVSASLGFLTALGSHGIAFTWVLMLLAGGVVAAPLAAWLVQRLAARVLGIAAGVLIILTNVKSVMERWFGIPRTSGALWVGLAVLAAAGAVLIVAALRQERRLHAATAEVATGPDVAPPERAVVDAARVDQ